MKEIICINIGQAGINIGNAFWEQMALEHGIQPDGTQLNTDDNSNFSSLFSESESGKLIPRCISVDLENDSLSSIKKSPYGQLFPADSYIYGKDGGCVYSKAYYEPEGKQVKERVFDKINALVERCEGLQGFLVFNSISGGTGSGLGAAICKHLSSSYYRSARINLALYPSPKFSNSVIEPYNAALAHIDMMNFNDLNITFDNEAIYNIIEQKLRIPNPSYVNINRLIAQVASSLTANIRFNGTANKTLGEISRSMVPFPRASFALPACGPLTSVEKLFFEHPSVSGITETLFDPTSAMAKCDYTKSKVVSCCVMFRGDALLYDVNAAITNIKSQRGLNFVDYILTGIKTSVLDEPPAVLPDGDLAETMRAGMMLMNSGAIGTYFEKMINRFNQIFSKRAFAHWYHGMDQGRLQEAGDNLNESVLTYQELCKETEPRRRRDSDSDEDVE